LVAYFQNSSMRYSFWCLLATYKVFKKFIDFFQILNFYPRFASDQTYRSYWSLLFMP